MALYREDVFCLVMDSIADFNALKALGAAAKINVGPAGSAANITAMTILRANGLEKAVLSHDEVKTGFDGVVTGQYDAAFDVSYSPSELLQQIGADAPVKLIKITMPADRAIYDANGNLHAADYAFQDVNADISGNITVRSVLAANPVLGAMDTDIFVQYILDHKGEFENYHPRWKDVSIALCQEFFKVFPEVADYKAFCALTGRPVLDPLYSDPLFYSGDAYSSASAMTKDLIWLMSHNAEQDYREVNSTGSIENSIRIADGTAMLGIVQDDMYEFYRNKNRMEESSRLAMMKKIIPLHYEYLHFLVNRNTSDGVNINSMADFSAGSPAVPRTINIGPKTSGTFITAITMLKSYGYDMDDRITFTHDSPHLALSKVNSDEYDVLFVLSGLPYYYFYSHDTWNISNGLGNTDLLSASFKGTKPYYYETGVIKSGTIYHEYPYNTALTGNSTASINTVRVRALLVASPMFDDRDIRSFIKSVIRKSDYMVNPPDPDLWCQGYEPDQLWIPIRKTSLTQTEIDYMEYGYYAAPYFAPQPGIKEYFAKNPFGWSDTAAEYYISLFPEEAL